MILRLLSTLLILFFANRVQCYDGPKTAGIEYYKVGTYQIKGYLICPKQKSCFLYPYYKTSRQYRIQLKGIISEKSNVRQGYYEVSGKVYRESIGDRLEFYVFDYPYQISSISALKNTVTQLKRY